MKPPASPRSEAKDAATQRKNEGEQCKIAPEAHSAQITAEDCDGLKVERGEGASVGKSLNEALEARHVELRPVSENLFASHASHNRPCPRAPGEAAATAKRRHGIEEAISKRKALEFHQAGAGVARSRNGR